LPTVGEVNGEGAIVKIDLQSGWHF
jgi:hypothetical protein